jgi:hypothetical protein
MLLAFFLDSLHHQLLSLLLNFSLHLLFGLHQPDVSPSLSSLELESAS